MVLYQLLTFLVFFSVVPLRGAEKAEAHTSYADNPKDLSAENKSLTLVDALKDLLMHHMPLAEFESKWHEKLTTLPEPYAREKVEEIKKLVQNPDDFVAMARATDRHLIHIGLATYRIMQLLSPGHLSYLISRSGTERLILRKSLSPSSQAQRLLGSALDRILCQKDSEIATAQLRLGMRGKEISKDRAAALLWNPTVSLPAKLMAGGLALSAGTLLSYLAAKLFVSLWKWIASFELAAEITDYARAEDISPNRDLIALYLTLSKHKKTNHFLLAGSLVGGIAGAFFALRTSKKRSNALLSFPHFFIGNLIKICGSEDREEAKTGRMLLKVLAEESPNNFVATRARNALKSLTPENPSTPKPSPEDTPSNFDDVD